MIAFKKATDEEQKAAWRIHRARHSWIGDWNAFSHCWIATENGQIVSTLREQFYPGGEFGEKERWIFNVWVRKGWRGKKLGQKLIQFYLDTKDPPIIFLDCRESLEPYYQKLGFTERVSLTPEEKAKILITDEPSQVILCRKKTV